MSETTASSDWMPLLAAVRQAAQAEVTHTQDNALARRRQNPVASIDALLEKLEQVHLHGRLRVPPPLLDEVAHTLGALPGCAETFAPRATVAAVMDRLFDIQDRLLSEQNQRRVALQRLDEVLEGRHQLG